MAFALGGGFLVVMASWNLVQGVREVFFYRHVQGTVTAYLAPNKAANEDLARGQLKFTYLADGSIHDGCFPPLGKTANKHDTVLNRARQIGDVLDVYFDPWDPSTCTLAPRINPFFLGFVIFTMPFLVLGLLLLFGREKKNDAFIISYIILSALCGFGLGVAYEQVGWQVLVCFGLPMPLLIPFVAWRLNLWVRGPGSGKGRDRAETASARRQRYQLIGLTMFNFFWWSVVDIVLFILIWSAAESISANRHYLIASGRVVANRLKVMGGRHPASAADIVYEYRVGDQLLQNDRLTFFELFGSKATAEEIRGKYQMGKEITVYYDPADPTRSVLDPSLPQSFYFLSLFISVFVVAGLVVLKVTIREWRAFLRQWKQGGDSRPADNGKYENWGRLETTSDGNFTIRGRPQWFGPVFQSYFITQILVILALAPIETVWPDNRLLLVGIAVVLASILVPLVFILAHRKARLIIDIIDRHVKLEGPVHRFDLRFDEIEAWEVIEVRDPRRSNAPGTVALLAICTLQGAELPVRFDPQCDGFSQGLEDAARHFARLTRKSVRAVAEPRDDFNWDDPEPLAVPLFEPLSRVSQRLRRFQCFQDLM
jgi:hypothetical protein